MMKRRNLMVGIAALGLSAACPALLFAQTTKEPLLMPGPLPEEFRT